MVDISFSVVLIATCTLAVAGVVPCKRPADIVLLLDRFVNDYDKDFSKQLNFMKSLIRHFDISVTTTRFAAATFGEAVIEQFPFGKYNTEDEVEQAISKITLPTSAITNTGDAIKFARETLFKTARPGVPRILIIWTSGISYSREYSVIEAMETKDSDIAVIILTVLRDDSPEHIFTEAELKEMASQPTENHLFVVNSDKLLDTFDSFVAKGTCNAKAIPPSVVPCSSTRADIVLLLDDSAAFDKLYFSAELYFTQRLVAHFDISSTTTRFAAATFDKMATEQFPFGKYNTADKIKEAIGNITRNNVTEEHTYEGIKFARETLFKTSRPGVPRILIILIQGFSQNIPMAIQEAQKTINTGITVIIVTVHVFRENSTSVSYTQTDLEKMTSKPTKDHLYNVTLITKLSTFKESVAMATCAVFVFLSPATVQYYHTPSLNAEIAHLLVLALAVYAIGGSFISPAPKQTIGGSFISPAPKQTTDAPVEEPRTEPENKPNREEIRTEPDNKPDDEEISE